MKRQRWEHLTGVPLPKEKSEVSKEHAEDAANRLLFTRTLELLNLCARMEHRAIDYRECRLNALQIPLDRTNIPPRLTIGRDATHRVTRELVMHLGIEKEAAWWQHEPQMVVYEEPRFTIVTTTDNGESETEGVDLLTDTILIMYGDLSEFDGFCAKVGLRPTPEPELPACPPSLPSL